MITTDVVVLLFGGRRLPGPLAGLATQRADGPDDIDAAAGRCRRLIVVGSDADLAAVLTRLLRADRLDVEVGHAAGMVDGPTRTTRHRTAGAVDPRRDRPRHRRRGRMARRGRRTAARRGGRRRHAAVRRRGRRRPDRADRRPCPDCGRRVTRRGRRRWVVGRAAQLGTTGAVVVRDGVPSAESRSPIYVLSPHAGLAAGEIGPCESSSPAATAVSARKRLRRSPPRDTAC